MDFIRWQALRSACPSNIMRLRTSERNFRIIKKVPRSGDFYYLGVMRSKDTPSVFASADMVRSIFLLKYPRMIIISDFSDTIATTSDNSKFPPFELEFGKMLGIDNRQSYEQFLEIRRNNSIPYNERMKVWLKPFTSLLEMNHIATLVSSFKLNQNFVRAVKIIKKS